VGLIIGRDSMEKRKYLTLPGLDLRPLSSESTDSCTLTQGEICACLSTDRILEDIARRLKLATSGH
jgi:DNA-binding CsgD family transcriptional regulator